MKPIIYTYSHDNIFAGVKQEASLFAERQFNKQTGESLFEEVVFDEEYLRWFRPAFFEAQADVSVVLSAYMKNIPEYPEIHESQDFRDCPDYLIAISMPESWNFHLYKPLDSKIKEYLVAKIMFRWLETKAPDFAFIYKQRSDAVLDEISGILNIRTGNIQSRGHYWEC
jgi:hypothetical protein